MRQKRAKNNIGPSSRNSLGNFKSNEGAAKSASKSFTSFNQLIKDLASNKMPLEM